MKTIGLLGGMSWQSTTHYYQHINEMVNQQLGGLHSAKIVMLSVDFDEIAKLQHQGDWETTAKILSNHAKNIEIAGAELLLICTNTMHKVADSIKQTISIPVLHIADATALKLKNDEITKVGLLATRFTMEEDFYKTRLTEKFGIDVVIPEENDRAKVHDIIYQELCHGIVNNASRDVYLGIIDTLTQQGAQAIILGCTEISMLISSAHTNVSLYDTTLIHAQDAVNQALSNK